MNKEQQLIRLLEKEQYFLWDDFTNAMDQAIRGSWSIQSEHVLNRIMVIAQAVGITPWRSIPISLLHSGIYSAIGVKLGLPEFVYDGKYTEKYPFRGDSANVIAEIQNHKIDDSDI